MIKDTKKLSHITESLLRSGIIELSTFHLKKYAMLRRIDDFHSGGR